MKVSSFKMKTLFTLFLFDIGGKQIIFDYIIMIVS